LNLVNLARKKTAFTQSSLLRSRNLKIQLFHQSQYFIVLPFFCNEERTHLTIVVNDQLMQQNGRRRVVSVDTESNILDNTSLRLVINNHTATAPTNGVKPLELQPT
jgi:hypothetical protein